LLRSEGSIGSRGLGLDGRPLSRNGRAMSSPETLEKVRRALTVGFANRIARRMRLHNGYRTCNQKGALAQVGWVAASSSPVHVSPGCCRCCNHHVNTVSTGTLSICWPARSTHS
jgi:hypothetical protein